MKACIRIGIVFVVLGCAPLFGQAELLRLRDGRLIEGKYVGGTEYVIRLHTAQGTREFPVEDILSLTFVPMTGPLPQRSPLPTPTPTPLPLREEISLPPDTRLSVRMTVNLDTLISRGGDQFGAQLENDLVVEGITVAPKGTIITGEVITSERNRTDSSLVITLQEMRVRNQVIHIRTTSYALWDRLREGEDSSARSIRTLRIASGAVLEFKITEAVTVKLR